MRGGDRPSSVGGGGLEDGIAIIYISITFIVHNQKSNGGEAMWGGGGHGVNWGGGGACPKATP